jgi:hypothetical protein
MRSVLLVPIDVERDALTEEREVDGAAFVVKIGCVALVETLDEFLVVGADGALRGEHLVEIAGRGVRLEKTAIGSGA